MEAYGFVAAAIRFSSSELVQSIKIVSDNRETTTAAWGASSVRNLIEPRLDLVARAADRFREIADDLAPTAPRARGIARARRSLPAPISFHRLGSRRLRRILQRWAALEPRARRGPENVEGACASEVLDRLERRLAASAPSRSGASRLTPLEWLLVEIIVVVGSVLQGAVGFGLGLLGAPLLVMLNPSLVPGPLLAGSLFLSILWRFANTDRSTLRGVGWALVGRVPGTSPRRRSGCGDPAKGDVASRRSHGAGRRGPRGHGHESREKPSRSLRGGSAFGLHVDDLFHRRRRPSPFCIRTAEGDRVRGTLSGFFSRRPRDSRSPRSSLVGRFGRLRDPLVRSCNISRRRRGVPALGENRGRPRSWPYAECDPRRFRARGPAVIVEALVERK